MNSAIIKEVLKCISYTESVKHIDLDLKGYTTSPDLLLEIIKDEIKSSDVIKFGYQKIDNGEEVFFAISTKHFKNFEFESEKDVNEFSSFISKGSNLSTKFIMNTTNMRKDCRSVKNDPNVSYKESKATIGKEKFIDTSYKPYGTFDIVVWMLVQIEIDGKYTNEVGKLESRVSFNISLFSEIPDVYEEINKKISTVIKAFETKIITRIILMRLNDTREWQKDLSVLGNEFNSRFLSNTRLNDKAKQGSSVGNQSIDAIAKKAKKPKRSRMEKWAQKMKKAEEVKAELDKTRITDESNDPLNITTNSYITTIDDANSNSKNILMSGEKEASNKDDKDFELITQKYEIKLVAKLRFSSTVSIKAIDNLSILKNLAVNNMKNVFIIK